MKRSIFTTSLLTFLITQSQAATLEFQGAASVDTGSGFSPALHYMALKGGDRVRAFKGCAKIIYDNGYCSKVCDGQMVVVFSTPPEPVASCSLRDTFAVSATPTRYSPDGSFKDIPAVSATPSEYVRGGGSLKDAPVVVAVPGTTEVDLLPAGLLAAAGGGMAFAIANSGGNDRAASP
jgi:hypothetical protein